MQSGGWKMGVYGVVVRFALGLGGCATNKDTLLGSL